MPSGHSAKYRPASTGILAAAVSAGDAIGRYLERGRGAWLARYGYLAAAQIDLAIPSLRLVGANPFNGQVNRMEMFEAILESCAITAIVETGTCRGATTEYMGRAITGKVYSCEVDPRYFGPAKLRLQHLQNIELQLLDSRRLLERLFHQVLPRDGAVFCYLDAHWNEDLPLLGEIELIMNSGVPAVVMIDDFEVPFDRGYGFDTYGKTRKLCLQMLAGFRDRLEYAYFPALPAETDSGPRRGAVIFATSAALDRQLATLPSLRRATARDWNSYSA